MTGYQYKHCEVCGKKNDTCTEVYIGHERTVLCDLCRRDKVERMVKSRAQRAAGLEIPMEDCD